MWYIEQEDIRREIQLASGNILINNHAITIDGAYADSLQIHYGSPRQHIWSYVSGHYNYPESK